VLQQDEPLLWFFSLSDLPVELGKDQNGL